jgi:hypothetical protein
MRRILKRRGADVPEYLRQAVQSGTYRTSEELAEMRALQRGEGAESENHWRGNAGRMRHDVVRGSSIHDYPAEYVILQQHPPLPDPPRTPRKYQRLRQSAASPHTARVQFLTQTYWQRQEAQVAAAAAVRRNRKEGPDEAAATATSGTADTDWYYRHLLRIPTPTNGGGGGESRVSSQSIGLQRAYAAAIQHYQLERTQPSAADGHNNSQADLYQQVDDLLATAQADEEAQAQQAAQSAQVWRDAQSTERNVVHTAQRRAAAANPETRATAGTTQADNADQDDSDDQGTDYLTALQANPRTWQALQRWSDRLQAVPYAQWTTGASTALDHWLAVTVLGLAEETWQALLQGDNDDSHSEAGPAIVAIRQALFPETILDGRVLLADEEEDDEAFAAADEAREETAAATQSVDDLLAALGALTEQPAGAEGIQDDDPDTDLIVRLTEELQDWRRKSQAGNLDDLAFAAWSRRYWETIGETAIPLDAFQTALLEDEPLDRAASEAFWNRLTTRQEAAELLQELETSEELQAVAKVFKVTTSTSIDDLWNLAALRPVLDEYTPENRRQAFLTKYGDILLEDLPLEHITADSSKESVPASSLPSSWAAALPAVARVRLQVLPYRRNADLYAMWKEHKAGRARYEEKLFLTKRLGLEYGVMEDDDDYDEDNV